MFYHFKKKKNIQHQASVPTFKEFVFQNIRKSGGSYNAEIVSLQKKIEKDIQLIELENYDFIKHNLLDKFDEKFLHENWHKFIDFYQGYINSELDLPVWLQKNCQEHYSDTIKLIKEKILSQFVSLLKIAKIWEEYFQNDKIFKLGLRDQVSHNRQFIEQYADLFLNDSPPIQEFVIQINSKSTLIAFKTIFRVYKLENIAPTQKKELLKEVQKRINVQNEVISHSIYEGEEIHGLIQFYENTKYQLEQIKIPKFQLHDKEEDLPKFKAICKDFLRAPKLFDYKIGELLDLVDQDSEQGLVFDIEPQKKGLFFFFIDTIMQNGVINKNIPEIIENRFTIGGNKVTDCRNQKSRSIQFFLSKLENGNSAMTNQKFQLMNHKYPNNRLR